VALGRNGKVGWCTAYPLFGSLFFLLVIYTHLVGLEPMTSPSTLKQRKYHFEVNGTPNGFFNSSHGLRYGDHLSPFLFVIVMRTLSRMMFATVTKGFVSSFSVGARNDDTLSVSHIFLLTISLFLVGLQRMIFGI
jgi:hypothetical protein